MSGDREPIRALVVDDEPLARQALREMLARERDLLVIGECADGAGAAARLRAGGVDLVFLDVQMPGLDGFDVIRAVGPERMPLVVFVTAYDEHAVRAFDAQALDYLLKPIDDRRFATAVARARGQLALTRGTGGTGGTGGDERVARLLRRLETAADPAAGRWLILRPSGRLVRVRQGDVDWIEAADYLARVHAGSDVHLVRETLTALEARLDGELFVRIHRSTIVNVDRIREVQPLFHGDLVVILGDGTQHRVSRSRRLELERRIGGD